MSLLENKVLLGSLLLISSSNWFTMTLLSKKNESKLKTDKGYCHTQRLEQNQETVIWSVNSVKWFYVLDWQNFNKSYSSLRQFSNKTEDNMYRLASVI